MTTLTALITRVISLPFTLVGLILSRILGVRRLRWNGSDGSNPGYSSLLNTDSNGDNGSIIVDPTAAAQWFLRYIKTCDPDPDGQGVDGSLWFTKGGYNAALRKAKEECQVLCVVLTSKEHDDNPAFMSQTLCSPGFKRLMQEHKGEIMFWGGDVCTSRDAQVASTILQAATYPFVAFLSMQPQPPSRITGSSSSSLSSNKMTVFSRLEGLQATTVPQVTAHITDTMAPRLNPYLGRLRAQRREREAQRLLREEQDRAYAEAGKRDMERVRAKEAELKAKEAEARLQREAEEQAKRVAEMKARESINRSAWRRKTASELGPEPADGTKLVIRLPDGRRLMRRFKDEEAAIRIWHYVECEAFNALSDTTTSNSTPDPGYKPEITFFLATTFPKRVIKPDTIVNKTVGDLVAEGILEKKVSSVIVEGLSLSADDEEEESDQEIEEEE
ncbi:hypothetical protein P389DRAFT_198888 [Cystobasidium minutum MCA 4210]|uniref:uncharacterized protein n=1 Tax=Cystobasidium minutum MCA 4210 TaxID=1397322 RepID=UPI0034CF27F4|eukprot:jgi/Rhomi1/198888/gm1.7102_g